MRGSAYRNVLIFHTPGVPIAWEMAEGKGGKTPTNAGRSPLTTHVLDVEGDRQIAKMSPTAEMSTCRCRCKGCMVEDRCRRLVVYELGISARRASDPSHDHLLLHNTLHDPAYRLAVTEVFLRIELRM